MKNKVLVILGPTATGKTSLSVRLAKLCDGEVISADSRQVYRGLDIGTGKITRSEMGDVVHHMLDVESPENTFSVSEFKNQADTILPQIIERGHLPILCGGTGFYIDAVVNDVALPDVPPNITLRDSLEKLSVEELFSMVEKSDEKRAKTIDKNNRPRLVRAIEIIDALGKVPASSEPQPKYDFLKIGLCLEKDEQIWNIKTRLASRLQHGLIEEVVSLHKGGLTYQRMNELGLEYKYIASYLQNELTLEEMTGKLETEIWRYSKRQMTWFKRDKNTVWFNPIETEKIVETVGGFLAK